MIKHLLFTFSLTAATLLGTSLALADELSQPASASADQQSPPASAARGKPGGQIDLSHWKLTLPVDADNTYGGHAKEIESKQLVAGFKDSHFYTDSSGAIVFWCPVNGSRTDNTKFARCELREMLEPGNPARNWGMPGTHVMEARCRLIDIPSEPKVVIGQIHSYTGQSKPLVKLQYYKGRIEALVKLSPDKGDDKKLTFAEAELNRDVTWSITLAGGVLSVDVNGMTQTENMVHHDDSWANETFYFKAGVYPQDNKGDSSEGARVSFSSLRVSHSAD
ncbi:polysaccharide lyase family 7 protein [Stieleria sp. TO1_6]|uniref:polysaccharide lyase family 7 protein n=1 Tax=Stieleria tagensis TaxID=2956795 RepID=UPI00209B1D72|nr:polysaccharide lyase family 7 protein [Stieleria tagensis]MCO8121271.1 polysaccharide lyase family 7 protein [Stieleria tagensis]